MCLDCNRETKVILLDQDREVFKIVQEIDDFHIGKEGKKLIVSPAHRKPLFCWKLNKVRNSKLIAYYIHVLEESTCNHKDPPEGPTTFSYKYFSKTVQLDKNEAGLNLEEIMNKHFHKLEYTIESFGDEVPSKNDVSGLKTLKSVSSKLESIAINQGLHAFVEESWARHLCKEWNLRIEKEYQGTFKLYRGIIPAGSIIVKNGSEVVTNQLKLIENLELYEEILPTKNRR